MVDELQASEFITFDQISAPLSPVRFNRSLSEFPPSLRLTPDTFSDPLSPSGKGCREGAGARSPHRGAEGAPEAAHSRAPLERGPEGRSVVGWRESDPQRRQQGEPPAQVGGRRHVGQPLRRAAQRGAAESAPQFARASATRPELWRGQRRRGRQGWRRRRAGSARGTAGGVRVTAAGRRCAGEAASSDAGRARSAVSAPPAWVGMVAGRQRRAAARAEPSRG